MDRGEEKTRRSPSISKGKKAVIGKRKGRKENAKKWWNLKNSFKLPS